MVIGEHTVVGKLNFGQVKLLQLAAVGQVGRDGCLVCPLLRVVLELGVISLKFLVKEIDRHRGAVLGFFAAPSFSAICRS